MKTLKGILLEGFLRKNIGLGKDALIRKWLDEYKITNYTINDDLTIDVDGDVDLDFYKYEKLPEYIQFGAVRNYFSLYCSSNLTSLKGCPCEVGGDFYCSGCINLESLEEAPQKVGGSFECRACNKLKSLEGAPQEVGWSFNCSGCSNLKSLKGCPKEVGINFYCSECKNLTSLKGCPKEIGGDFYCKYHNKRFTTNDIKKVCKVKGEIRI